jgi:hypothetical protein
MAIKLPEARRKTQNEQREWSVELSRWLDLDPTLVAQRAGLAGTTLTRLLNDKKYRGVLRATTVRRLTEFYRVPSPEEFARGVQFPGAEAELVDLKTSPELVRISHELAGENSNLELWRLRTDMLAAAGYLAGDILFVDPSGTPKRHDVVSAQIFELARTTSVTVWRVYEPPYLVGAGLDRIGWKPVTIDGERVRLRGVVKFMIRPHGLSDTR